MQQPRHPGFAARAAAFDETDTFVADNYTELTARRFFAAGVPAELGGGGASPASCAPCSASWPATAARPPSRSRSTRTSSRRTRGAGATNARWRRSCAASPRNGSSSSAPGLRLARGLRHRRRGEGGYRVTGRKIFASGSPAGSSSSPARSTRIRRRDRPCWTSQSPLRPEASLTEDLADDGHARHRLPRRRARRRLRARGRGRAASATGSVCPTCSAR